MIKADFLSFRDTNYFSELICEYLEGHENLDEFYGRFPNLESFADQIKDRKDFSQSTRDLLVQQITNQYETNGIALEKHRQVATSIGKLSNPNCFTLVTGHQLNILTGPLYFLYKIVSCINLSKTLQSAYPNYQFVPVYWMATEDHDFAEINYINLYGGRLQWQAKEGGPVGRMSTSGMQDLIDELEEHLGPGSLNKELIDLFRSAYVGHDNLTQATRFLVNELFGKYGLICIDGDDRELKSLMIRFFERELLDEFAHDIVHATTDRLEELHFKQVHPRPINLFYIKDGLRERIERDGDKWKVLNTSIEFSKEQIREELQSKPERFSPNVILRPVYQETILPNLAYIGGGGELAYWFQLKQLFQAIDIPFPILVLRNSVLFVKAKNTRKLQKIKLLPQSMFQSLQSIQNEYVKDGAPVDPALSPYEQRITQIFDELEDVARLTDDSMLGAVNAQKAKQLKGLKNLRKKLIRAEKRRRSDEMDRIERVYYNLFPSGSLQERHDNITAFYSEYGHAFIEKLFEFLDPLDHRFVILSETE